jgi:hypothetical protein
MRSRRVSAKSCCTVSGLSVSIRTPAQTLPVLMPREFLRSPWKLDWGRRKGHADCSHVTASSSPREGPHAILCRVFVGTKKPRGQKSLDRQSRGLSQNQSKAEQLLSLSSGPRRVGHFDRGICARTPHPGQDFSHSKI